jgi:imidazolonepropionase-like amidohydrolase
VTTGHSGLTLYDMTTTTDAMATERAGRTVLLAAWLFDGITDTLLENPVVVLEGRAITEIGTALPAGPGDRNTDGATGVIDLAGATILPGLVDGHVHLAFDSSNDPVSALAGRTDAEALAAMAAAARRAAKGGVTTVRDLGDRNYLSLRLREAALTDHTLPTIVAAGPPITTPGGHCHFLGGGTEVADVRAAVREHAERGVDVIKIMASGGNMTPGSRVELSQFDVDALWAAVDEAHRYGLPITAHAHGTQAIVDALAAGVDGLEHVTFMTADGVDPIPDAVLTALAVRPVTLSLSLGLVPAPGSVPPPGILARGPAMVANFQRLYQAGAFIIAGTDAGIAPMKPPDCLRWSLRHLIQLGMTPAEGLRAMTSRAAAVCGLDDRKGRLAPGYDADILAVDGNPLADPDSLHRIRAVYVRGQALVSGGTAP